MLAPHDDNDESSDAYRGGGRDAHDPRALPAGDPDEAMCADCPRPATTAVAPTDGDEPPLTTIQPACDDCAFARVGDGWREYGLQAYARAHGERMGANQLQVSVTDWFTSDARVVTATPTEAAKDAGVNPEAYIKVCDAEDEVGVWDAGEMQ